eukprot:TRINITY_DN7766_c0_g2_i11.p1 TRINITY_DN7766_c0_g2~~TRINITY_DN7766_c0_g2_i11.p1  ORF type:complete len:144 (-),score=47.60 TRINITY_DN7766_c0_g2_i11:453-848(-)
MKASNSVAKRNLSSDSGGKKYYVSNLKEIKRRREEFAKRQKEAQESEKESNWKMKRFLKIESSIKKDIREAKKHKAEDAEREQKKIREKLKNLNKSEFIKKNILQVQVKKPKEKSVEEVSGLNPDFGKVPK